MSTPVWKITAGVFLGAMIAYGFVKADRDGNDTKRKLDTTNASLSVQLVKPAELLLRCGSPASDRSSAKDPDTRFLEYPPYTFAFQRLTDKTTGEKDWFPLVVLRGEEKADPNDVAAGMPCVVKH